MVYNERELVKANAGLEAPDMELAMQPSFAKRLNEVIEIQEDTIAMLKRIEESLFLISDAPNEKRPIKCMDDAIMEILDTSTMIRECISDVALRIGV